MSGPLLTGYTQTINDYYDKEIDAINEPNRPIPSGTAAAPVLSRTGADILPSQGRTAEISQANAHHTDKLNFLQLQNCPTFKHEPCSSCVVHLCCVRAVRSCMSANTYAWPFCPYPTPCTAATAHQAFDLSLHRQVPCLSHVCLQFLENLAACFGVVGTIESASCNQAFHT